MKMNLLKSSLAVFMAGILVMSCQKDEFLDDSKLENEILVQEGRLVFKDADTFRNTIEELGGVDEESRTKWLEQFQGFEPLLSSNVEKPFQTSGYLDYVANSQFLYQVGNEIIYRKDDIEYIFENDSEVLKKVLNSKDEEIGHIAGIKTFKIERHEIPVVTGDGKTNGENQWGGYYDRWFDHGGGIHRFVFSAWAENTYYGSTINFSNALLFQKKDFWGRTYWVDAGAQAKKDVYNVVMYGNTLNAYPTKTYSHLTTNSSNTIKVWANATGCGAHASITVGNSSSVVTQPDWSYPSTGPYSYSVNNAQWTGDVCK